MENILFLMNDINELLINLNRYFNRTVIGNALKI